MNKKTSNFFPSMTGLRAFEAAARHHSFTRAAIELNLTQSAVSHQIRKLEELLGVSLFDRVGNEIQMTESGLEYYNVARTTITEIRFATDRAIRQGQDDVLTIGALSTFAVKCLLPNLKDFTENNPDIDLRLRILPTSPDASRDDCDVLMLYGQEANWPGFIATRVTVEELFPVCSPALLEGPNALRNPADLAEHTIVRTISPLILRDDWPFWLRRAGVAQLSLSKEITCDLLYPSYQLAIEGLGVAMGRSAVVKGDIAAGRLVEPFSIRLPSSLGYHIMHPPHRIATPKVERFVTWVRDVLSAKLSDDGMPAGVPPAEILEDEDEDETEG